MRKKHKWDIGKPVKKRKGKPMNVGLQIYNLKRLFYKLNPREDFKNIDLDFIDPTATFPENLEIIKEENPRYRWEIPQEKKKTQIRDKIHWKRHIYESLNVFTTSVPIRRHELTVKKENEMGSIRKYKKLYGRIQVIVDRKWIGQDAKIIVRISDEELYSDVQES